MNPGGVGSGRQATLPCTRGTTAVLPPRKDGPAVAGPGVRVHGGRYVYLYVKNQWKWLPLTFRQYVRYGVARARNITAQEVFTFT
jgi:hypothetical protein